MSLAKVLFASTAIGAVVATAPIAFFAGKFFGRSEQKKMALATSSKIGKFQNASTPTPWSNKPKTN